MNIRSDETNIICARNRTINELETQLKTTKQELADNEDILVEMERKLKASEAECERLRNFFEKYGVYRNESSKISKHIGALELDAMYLSILNYKEQSK